MYPKCCPYVTAVLSRLFFCLSFTVMGVTCRLPFFPQPEPLELISNWLSRLAWAYHFDDSPVPRCTIPDVAISALPQSFLPPVFLNHLCDLTDIPFEQLSRMTLAHWVPCLAVSSHASRQLFRDYIYSWFSSPLWSSSAQVYARFFGFLSLCSCVSLGKSWSLGRASRMQIMRRTCRKKPSVSGLVVRPDRLLPLARNSPCVSRGWSISPETRVRLTVDWFTSMALRCNRLFFRLAPWLLGRGGFGSCGP